MAMPDSAFEEMAKLTREQMEDIAKRGSEALPEGINKEVHPDLYAGLDTVAFGGGPGFSFESDPRAFIMYYIFEYKFIVCVIGAIFWYKWYSTRAFPEYPESKVVQVKKLEDFKALLNSQKLVVAAFYQLSSDECREASLPFGLLSEVYGEPKEHIHSVFKRAADGNKLSDKAAADDSDSKTRADDEEFPLWNFVKVDAIGAKDVAFFADVKTQPSFKFYVDGQEVVSLPGFTAEGMVHELERLAPHLGQDAEEEKKEA